MGLGLDWASCLTPRRTRTGRCRPCPPGTAPGQGTRPCAAWRSSCGWRPRSNVSVLFRLRRPPPGHPHHHSWVNDTLEAVLHSGIRQEQVTPCPPRRYALTVTASTQQGAAALWHERRTHRALLFLTDTTTIENNSLITLCPDWRRGHTNINLFRILMYWHGRHNLPVIIDIIYFSLPMLTR